jgi:hypothetical protein
MPKQSTEEAERDLTIYADKEPTDLQERFAVWIPEATGYDPATAKTKTEAFEEGVRLATALRMIFQASPENQEALAARRSAVAQAKTEQSPNGSGRRGKKVAEVEEPQEEPAEEVPATRRGRRGAATPAPPEKAAKTARRPEPEPAAEEARPVRRPARRRGATAPADTSDAPF